ncbi:MAG: non-canonical purine NTP pyrophosphatase, partial [Phycisphaerae bacterium]|nr:non-canonical purine NTP pyrophosphatase [Phycisphaerae bacterium]
MTRSLLIATHNKKKLAEMADILSDLPLKMLSPADFGDIPPPEETGDTFEENACEKALAYARATGLWSVADDSGLEVACLGGRPGVRSSRWGGRAGDDARNREKLLAEVARYRPEQWQARYVCVAALAAPEKILITTRGTCSGIITASGRGTWGFG